MSRNFCTILLTIIFLVSAFFPASLAAFEPGLLIDQKAGFGGEGSTSEHDYEATFIPRLSFLIGDNGEFYFSAGLMLKNKSEIFSVIPELLHTELLLRFDGAKIQAGRMHYADPLGFIANGLFDGAQFTCDTSAGTFGVGAWYTGLLYKEKAYITISPQDSANYATVLDMGKFADTYFASRRLIAAVDWEHPFIAETLQLNATLIAQTDLNDTDSPYHSQYAALLLSVPVSAFLWELGGGLEIIEYADDVRVAFAGSAEFFWTPPATFHSQLSFTGRFTSGTTADSSVAAFTPITALPHGDILQAKLSGLSILSIDYIARVHRTFSAGITGSYFVRSDLGTFMEYPVDNSATNKNEHFLGAELVARLIWSPLSDLQITASGGIFLPSLGNAAPKADNQWRTELGVIIAF